MVEYEYSNKAIDPDLPQIHIDVEASEMTNKDIDYCIWNEDDEILRVYWTGSLDANDKTELDTIVANNS